MQLIDIHQEIPYCHSKHFDLLRACPERLDPSSTTGPVEEVNSAKDLKILRSPAILGTPQNDNRKVIFGLVVV